MIFAPRRAPFSWRWWLIWRLLGGRAIMANVYVAATEDDLTVEAMHPLGDLRVRNIRITQSVSAE